ncbi:MAG TPA: hypothetical protein EYO73_06425 [Sulfurimonas sp.]|nr:hypothetical protein [Sulfurimonas sp.]
MKAILFLSILLTLGVHADYVKKTIGVCSSEETLIELKTYSKTHILEKGGIELEMWMMAHNCKIIDKNTKIQILDYTGKNSEVLKVLLKQTGDIVYTTNKGIQIEQPGQDNIIYKF